MNVDAKLTHFGKAYEENMYTTISFSPGTKLFHGSHSFTSTAYSLPLHSFPGIAFFSSADIAQRYGSLSTFVVMEEFKAVILNDANNMALWRRDLPEHDVDQLDAILKVTHLDQERIAPHHLAFMGGVPIRTSESGKDKRMFANLMDLANVDAIFVSVDTSMRHPELAVRFHLSSGMFCTQPAIERFHSQESLRDAWLMMIGRVGEAAAPKEVGHTRMKAYVKWLWQWCQQLNVPDQRIYLFIPLGLLHCSSLWQFKVPAYDKSMAEVGVDESGYLTMIKVWHSLLKPEKLNRMDAPIVLAVKPTLSFNTPPFEAFLEHAPMEDPMLSRGAFGAFLS